jgi:hypothetical protein
LGEKSRKVKSIKSRKLGDPESFKWQLTALTGSVLL